MDFFDKDIIRFFECLNSCDVEYILVGGLAVNYHGFSRSTGDIDIWLNDEKDNRLNLINALDKYGIEGAEVFHELPFIAGYSELLLDNGIYIDLMSDLQFFKRENFKTAYVDANLFSLNDITIKVLHINALIQEKEKSGRAKDQMDAIELKKLYRL